MKRFVFCGLQLLAALVGLSPAISQGADLVSVGSPSGSFEPTISQDGTVVAFTSTARLAAADANAGFDVYARNRVTKQTRLLSDSRGGSQPITHANGRFVVFKSTGTIPQLMIADLEGVEPARVASFPISGFSFQSGDLGVLSPDARFLAYVSKPAPGLTSGRNPAIIVNDTTITNRVDSNVGRVASTSSDDSLDTPPTQLIRTAMTRDGNVFFIELRDGIDPQDTGNATGDIYMFSRNVVRRLSSTESNPDESAFGPANSAHDPVVSANPALPGQSAAYSVFYISERKLRNADTDNRGTIYRNDISGTVVGLPTPVPTPGVRPLMLSRQAVGDGQYLVFVGLPASGPPRPYILQLSTGAMRVLAGSCIGAPVLSADNSTIAFSTALRLSGADRNSAPDIYTVPNPFLNSRLTPPTVTLGSARFPAGGTLVEMTTGSGIQVTATASNPNGGSFDNTVIEFDGQVMARSFSASTSVNFTPSLGAHTLRARTVDRSGMTGSSQTVQIIVKPSAGGVSLRGVVNLVRGGDSVGREVFFNGRLQLDNNSATPRSGLRVLLKEAASTFKWDFFGADRPPEAPARILAILDGLTAQPTNNVPSTPTEVAFASATRAPKVVSTDGFVGLGSDIFAQLQVQSGNNWINQGNPLPLFSVRPRLSDQTPGPNGGVPVGGSTEQDANFSPATVTNVFVAGNAAMASRTARTFTASATFQNSGDTRRQINPRWSVVPANAGATINAAGVLTVGNIPTARTVRVQGTFGPKTGVLNVSLRPTLPTVAVASSRIIKEGATGAIFRVLRSPAAPTPLTVNLAYSGTANDPARPGQNDYNPLPESVTIPAGRAFVDVPVTVNDDANFEGNETILATIQASGEYRLGAGFRAALVITDTENEPPPAGACDATIRAGTGPIVGINQYEFNSFATQQIATANVALGQSAVFTLAFTNRSTVASSVNFQAGGDFNGYVVRYFRGNVNVTADVLSGNFDLTGNNNSLAPGQTASLRMFVTPLSTSLVGSTFPGFIFFSSNVGADPIQANVRRIR